MSVSYHIFSGMLHATICLLQSYIATRPMRKENGTYCSIARLKIQTLASIWLSFIFRTLNSVYSKPFYCCVLTMLWSWAYTLQALTEAIPGIAYKAALIIVNPGYPSRRLYIGFDKLSFPMYVCFLVTSVHATLWQLDFLCTLHPYSSCGKAIFGLCIAHLQTPCCMVAPWGAGGISIVSCFHWWKAEYRLIQCGIRDHCLNGVTRTLVYIGIIYSFCH